VLTFCNSIVAARLKQINRRTKNTQKIKKTKTQKTYIKNKKQQKDNTSHKKIETH